MSTMAARIDETAFKGAQSRRRGVILVMVVGVLAMMFIVGATLLVVARSERELAEKADASRTLKNLIGVAELPMATQLREDVVGKNGSPYDRGWSVDDSSILEDSADFAGRTPTTSAGRTGDLILASIEPYQLSPGEWRYYSTSWVLDAVEDFGEPEPPTTNSQPVLPTIGLNNDNPRGDADGDGVTDSYLDDEHARLLTGSYGHHYELYHRLIPHGGMVLLDSFTHPTLLSQVIHPYDSDYHEDPLALWSESPALALSLNDEGDLRRRGILPPRLTYEEWQALPETDMRRKLRYTVFGLNYNPSQGDEIGTHYWPILPSNPLLDPNDWDWWQQKMTPGVSGNGLTESGYSAGSDNYDRRHLITTRNNDDLLRQQRDERRLKQFVQTDAGGNFYPFYEAIQPDAGWTPNWNRPAPYGWDPLKQELAFNVPDLRMPFSLRDVLVDPNTNPEVDSLGVPVPGSPGAQASYRKAVQLTAYFLAMIQHTEKYASGSLAEQLEKQLRAAAQLAVNTIDFADRENGLSSNSVANFDDSLPTYFSAVYDLADPDGNPIGQSTEIRVYGVERQPYITEAYAKVVYRPDTTNTPPTAFQSSESAGDSIYAVELYNPYDVVLRLDDYILETDLGSFPLSGYWIPPHSYLVLADQENDPNFYNGGSSPGGQSPFIPNANISAATATPTTEDGYSAGTPFRDLQVLSGLKFANSSEGIKLIRSEALKLRPDGVELVSGSFIVDQLMPVGIDEAGNLMAVDSRWMYTNANYRKPGYYPDPDDQGPLPAEPNGILENDDLLVFDCSLQRHKELVADPSDTVAPYTYRPAHWNFTLSLQAVFPLPWYEAPDFDSAYGGTSPYKPHLPRSSYCIPQHNLLGSVVFKSPDINISNQQAMVRYAQGRRLEHALLNPATPYAPGTFLPFVDPDTRSWSVDDINQNVISQEREQPIAGMPVFVANSGIDDTNPATMGTLAFPTTGSLLLVSRYSHEQFKDGSNWKNVPFTVAATKSPDELNKLTADVDLLQMQWIDNGHMPIIVDSGEATTDLPTDDGRLDVPWGQLVFNYFTALPLEELYREINLGSLDGLSGTDALMELDDENYELAYRQLFRYYPLIDRVEGLESRIGPNVRGRININAAPWWVLDGLPALPNDYSATGTYNENYTNYDVATLPVKELRSTENNNWLDPAGYSADSQAGRWFVELLMDELGTDGLGVNMPSISPRLARYLVGLPSYPGTSEAGYLTVGSIADPLYGVPLSGLTDPETGAAVPVTSFKELRRYRSYAGDLASPRPFSYLGYQQLVTPLVRLQDWATVKNHVFTLYSLVGDTLDPPQWLRSQATLDRTRCLYSAQLPDKLISTEGIGYFNAASDE